VALYRSDDVPYEWSLYAAPQVWSATYNWGEDPISDGGYYYATEIGNGETYAGESAPSNVFEVL
jgi:hypothetical protein